jgi:hypothetical protein
MAQEPIATTHLGSGICSHSLSTRGAILVVMVPATTITSQCRGVARRIVPMRSRSTRLAAPAMNSMPQHEVAMGNIHNELVSPQVKRSSMAVTPTARPGASSIVS